MRAYERLIKYAKVSTASEEGIGVSPSTARQFDLARLLVEELRGLGVADAEVTDTCYVYGHLPATPGHEGAPCLGFIAHMDTSPDFSGENVKPRVIENYDGGDLELGAGRTLSVKQFPHLPSLKGRTLITASGDTLLGADDKAGIAEIMTLIEQLQGGEIAHGRIAVCFTPDEEVGCGTANFDIPKLGADFAYTLDGGAEGEVVYENFNACSAVVNITGVNVHPGSAKNVMVNAALVATELGAALWLQFAVFLVVSILALIATRPLARKMLDKTIVPTNADRVLHHEAKVTETVDNENATGAVYIDGKTWTARSEDGNIIPKGKMARIVRMEGVKLYVRESKEPSERRE